MNDRSSSLVVLLLAIPLILMAACASPFPRPEAGVLEAVEPSAKDILSRCVSAHGGDLRARGIRDLALSVEGAWAGLVKRIQPLVTDYGFRVSSEERFFSETGVYAVKWTGPAGVKRIFRDRVNGVTEVSYNDVPSLDPDVIASTAMTSDATIFFHYGPSPLLWWGGTPTRLADASEEGRRFYQLYFVLEPGFGQSNRDEIVAWIDAESFRLHRIWFTLEGFSTTRGATADVTFLEYQEFGDGVLLPVAFHERVRAPLSIDAHHWRMEGLEVNRGIAPEAVRGPWAPAAAVSPRRFH